MKPISIVAYTSELQQYFESNNKEWVSKHFTLEPFDIAQLENPDKYIIQKGGAILFAKENKEIIGTIGLVKIAEENIYELIKMGVLPKAQGKGVAHLLIQAILNVARNKGAKKIILYSSSKLIPALSLYKKVGFIEAIKECGKYARCDMKMEMEL